MYERNLTFNRIVNPELATARERALKIFNHLVGFLSPLARELIIQGQSLNGFIPSDEKIERIRIPRLQWLAPSKY
ncbi:MAG: hypothetical protein NZO16_00495 [Deltaproteobacteria bacterium]|nr:hypothetical protein [Deltaproteobacteria bacterium]